MILETDLIVEIEVHIIVEETEEIIRIAIIIVIEVIDPEMGNIKQIGIMVEPIIEGRISIKIMVREIQTEV